MSNQKIRAQFWVQKVTKQAASGGASTHLVEMAAVVRGVGQQGYNPEGNTDWSKFTPSGTVTMTVSNESAGEAFNAAVGKDVAITFEILDDVE